MDTDVTGGEESRPVAGKGWGVGSDGVDPTKTRSGKDGGESSSLAVCRGNHGVSTEEVNGAGVSPKGSGTGDAEEKRAVPPGDGAADAGDDGEQEDAVRQSPRRVSEVPEEDDLESKDEESDVFEEGSEFGQEEGDTTDGTKKEDMLNHDNETLRERVTDLEKKIHEQSDEITCLRSTLADLLRRVNQLEGRAPIITNSTSSTPTKSSPSSFIPSHRQSFGSIYRQSSSSSSSIVDGVLNNHHPPSPQGPAPPVPQSNRRLSHHTTTSTSSLHSEGNHSSNSASPIPSPAPSQGSSFRTTPSPRHTPSPNRHMSASTSNLHAMKRWSGSQDFMQSNKRGISGSLFNLPVRSPSGTLLRHGTKEANFIPKDGTVRMYLRGRPLVMHVPTDILQNYDIERVNGTPNQRLKLEWVYGYRGKDCRSNLYLLPTGEIVYFTAGVVVLHNVDDQTQRHYLGHTDDIKCLAVHPNKLTIATGQVASVDRRDRRNPPQAISSDGNQLPHVRIWDSVTLNTLRVIEGDFVAAVRCVAFSKTDGGSILCAIDDSTEHTISLWDWQKGYKGEKITETKSSPDPVLAAEFHPMDKYTLITLGKNHIHFWNIEGGTLSKRLGAFEKSEKPKYVLCMTFTDTGELLTGDSNGNIIVWQKGSNRVERVIRNAHYGSVFSLCVMKNGNIVSGGGKDGTIIEWTSDLSKTGNEARLPGHVGGVRFLSHGNGNMLLVGTTKNSILQGTFKLNFSMVLQGHFEQIWALAVHPTQNQFVTGGYDSYIHYWDTMSHSVVWSEQFEYRVQAACFSPDGSVLIVTTDRGTWYIIDAATRQIYGEHTDGKEQIDSVKFSPDGNFLALGSHDNYIYVYQTADRFRKYSRIGKCIGHSSFVTHIDWSEDSQYLQSSSGDYELLYWKPSVCQHVTDMSIARDIKWKTHSCVLGFHVLGIWPENADGTDINTCNRSHSGKLLATGDDFGKVKLFSFPACQRKCLHHAYGGHSSHVTAVNFLPGDTRVISLGGADNSILQWAVI